MTFAQLPKQEAISSGHHIIRSLDRIMESLNGLNDKQLNYQPPARGANSIYMIATHALASAEESLLKTINGQPISRDRKQEFSARADAAAPLQQYWQQQRKQLQNVIDSLSENELEREYRGANGETLTGSAILLTEALHIAEHLGQAEVTRDLARSI
jgi:hypothetical protein